MEIREDGSSLELLTTDGKLAQRIGREVRKACAGTLAYKRSEDTKLLRVVWVRDG